MKIKICGLKPERDAQLCIDLGINFLGFVFYEKSPRNINPKDIKILSKYDKKNSVFVSRQPFILYFHPIIFYISIKSVFFVFHLNYEELVQSHHLVRVPQAALYQLGKCK